MPQIATESATIHALPELELTESEEMTLELHRFAHADVLPRLGDDKRALYNAALQAILTAVLRRQGVEIPHSPAEMPLKEAFVVLRTI